MTSSTTTPSLHSPSHPWALPVGVVALLGLFIGFQPLPFDPDLWFHLAGGRYMLSEGCVPQSDPFSFTRMGQLWVPHSWLFDVTAYALWTGIGPRATEAVTAAAFAVTLLMSLAILSQAGAKPITATAICVALAIGAANTRGIRPQVLSLLSCNLVILLCVAHARRPSRRIMYASAVIFVVWAQLHAACVMGVAVLAIWCIGRLLDAASHHAVSARKTELVQLVAATMVAAAVILITPHRMSHYGYALMTMRLNCLKLTGEWQMPRALSLDVPDVYLYMLLIGVVVGLARGRHRPGWAPLMLFIAIMLLAFSGVRHIPLACIAAVPLFADVLRNRPSTPDMQARLSVLGPVGDVFRSASFRRRLVVTAGLCLVVTWRYPSSINDRYAAAEPVVGGRALAALERPLNVFTTYNTGSYILWSAPNRLKVMVDSRADVYGDAIIHEVLDAQSGRNWQAVFDKRRIAAAVLENHDRLTAILASDPRWMTLARDAGSTTFIRAASPGALASRPAARTTRTD